MNMAKVFKGVLRKASVRMTALKSNISFHSYKKWRMHKRRESMRCEIVLQKKKNVQIGSIDAHYLPQEVNVT